MSGLCALIWSMAWRAVCVALCAGALAGCSTLTSTAVESCAAEQCRPLYLVRRGWHIDLAFEAEALAPPLASVAQRLGTPRYVVVGFGDRRYLQAPPGSSFSTVAALWPGDGLMLVTGLVAPPEKAFGESQVVTLEVPSNSLDEILRYVQVSFQAREMGNGVADATSFEPVGDGPYTGSLFYDAAPKYSAVHTCNTWVAEALRAGGIPIRTRGVVFAGQVWPAVKRLGKAPPSAPSPAEALRRQMGPEKPHLPLPHRVISDKEA